MECVCDAMVTLGFLPIRMQQSDRCSETNDFFVQVFPHQIEKERGMFLKVGGQCCDAF